MRLATQFNGEELSVADEFDSEGGVFARLGSSSTYLSRDELRRVRDHMNGLLDDDTAGGQDGNEVTAQHFARAVSVLNANAPAGLVNAVADYFAR